MADTQIYGHHDIQRYLEHKMMPLEMHDFEKALMNDPFLADALEGFSLSDAAKSDKHLAEIEGELIGQKRKGKIVVMPPKTTAWWKVAAVVLAVVSGGVLTYTSFTKTGGEKDVAQQRAPREAAEMTTKTDSVEPTKPLAGVEVPNKELLHKRQTTPIIREGKAEPAGGCRELFHFRPSRTPIRSAGGSWDRMRACWHHSVAACRAARRLRTRLTTRTAARLVTRVVDATSRPRRSAALVRRKHSLQN
jgi:hypothetical protein